LGLHARGETEIFMRIAVSGTHSVGKSTLVADLLAALPGYRHEEEPYRALRGQYPIKFGKESTRYCNGLQTYYSISRALSYRSSADCVVFDRAPVDYIAYSQYTAHYGETDLDKGFVASLVEPVRDSLVNLDLIVFVPISKHHPMHLEADGIRPIDPTYRVHVDKDFKAIYREGAFGLLDARRKGNPRVLEVQGSREERVAQVLAEMKRLGG
jgi:predicted ATPase